MKSNRDKAGRVTRVIWKMEKGSRQSYWVAVRSPERILWAPAIKKAF